MLLEKGEKAQGYSCGSFGLLSSGHEKSGSQGKKGLEKG